MPPLRIGMVSIHAPPYPGGISEATARMAEAYDRAGHEVRWISSRLPLDAPPQTGYLHRIPNWNFFETHFGISWPLWTWKGLREARKLTQWADVVHVQECVHIPSAFAVLFAAKNGKPVVVSQHVGFIDYPSPFARGLLTFLYHTVGKWVLRNTNRLVYCNLSAEEYLTRLTDVSRLNPVRIPCAVDTDRFSPPTAQERSEARRALGVPEDKPVALFVGRLVGKKRPDLFFGLCDRVPAHYLVVGDGVLRPRQEQRNVTWIPYMPAQTVQAAYRAADVFILPAYGEGLPLVAVEAMATGLPVILANVQNYAKELAAAGRCLAVDPQVSALEAALRSLLTQPEKAAAIAAAGRRYAVESHGLQAVGDAYLGIVNELSAEKELMHSSQQVYDSLWETSWGDLQRYGPVHRHTRADLARMVARLGVSSVLDVGCGSGENLLSLAESGNYSLTGTDVSEEALVIARKRVPGARFVPLDVEHHALPERFDLVMSSQVVEHIVDDIAAIRHMAEMSARYVFVATMQGTMRPSELKIGHVRNYSAIELQRKLELAGLRVISVWGWGFPFYSPLFRTASEWLPGGVPLGQMSAASKCIAGMLYHLYKLNWPGKGDILNALAEKSKS